MIGKTLGHYRIVEKLGQGGMGEVFLAEDLSLGRKAALKFLPENFAGDSERMARFEREAKLLASLNHPNIAGIYGLEQAEGKRFLALEYVDGETLGQRISKGALPVDEALDICKQIAEGVEAAHEKGVIHRDLKPENVKITSDGKVKVLDFGLAKALADEAQDGALSQSPTITEAMTRPGVILGTAAYMSPEQAKGKVVDKRTDIWALGCILYECLTGKRAFSGETVTETLAAILRAEPDWQALPEGTLPGLRSLLRRCLNKEVRNRLQSISDIRIELEVLSSEPFAETSNPRQTKPGWNRRLVWITASAFLGGAILGAFIFYSVVRSRKTAPEAAIPLVHATIELPKDALLALGSQIPLVGYNSPIVSLSSQGQYLAYVGKSSLGTIVYLRSMATGEIRPIAGTDGAIYPFFSPDEKWMGFLTHDKVKKVALHGGAPITLCEARTPVLAWWTTDNTVFFTESETGQIGRVSAEGGASATVLVARDAGLDSVCDVLPDGKWIIATRANGIGGDRADIFLVNPATRETKLLVRSGFGARYVHPGYLLFARAGGLMAVSFDASRQEIHGEPISILTGVSMESLFWIMHASSTRNGVLAYAPGGDLSIGNLAWVDGAGNTEYLKLPTRVYGVLDLAPSGKKIAVHVADVKDYILIYDIQRGEGRRISGVDPNGWPLWFPDGSRISVSAFGDGNQRQKILLIDSNEGVNSEPRQLKVPFAGSFGASSWLPNGQALAIEAWGGLKPRTEFISLGSNGTAPGFDGYFSSFSPDGCWVAYNSDLSGQPQVYIRSYPDGKLSRQVSVDGGFEPRWKASGELFYRNGGRWMSTRVTTGPEPRWDPPRLAFETEFIDTPGMSYDVTPDGRRLLVVKRAQSVTQSRIDLILNWTEALKREK